MTTNKPPLWKQIVGAVVGAGVALGVYGVYSVASPHLKAYVLTPQSWLPERSAKPVAMNDKTMDEELAKRIVARTEEILANNTVPQDSQYLDDGQAIRRYPIAAVRVAAAQTSSEHTAAPASDAGTPVAVQDRWDTLAPGNTAPVLPESQPEPAPYVPPVTASVAQPVQAEVAPPDLPSSGIGLSLIAGAALGGAFMARKKKSA